MCCSCHSPVVVIIVIYVCQHDLSVNKKLCTTLSRLLDDQRSNIVTTPFIVFGMTSVTIRKLIQKSIFSCNDAIDHTHLLRFPASTKDSLVTKIFNVYGVNNFVGIQFNRVVDTSGITIFGLETNVQTVSNGDSSNDPWSSSGSDSYDYNTML